MEINLTPCSNPNIVLQIAKAKTDFLKELSKIFPSLEYKPSFVLRLLDIWLSQSEIIKILSDSKLFDLHSRFDKIFNLEKPN